MIIAMNPNIITTIKTDQMRHSGYRIWFIVSMFDLFAAAIIGVLLRAMYFVEVPFVTFRPWLHGHSHTALLGWLFIGTVVCLLHDGGLGRFTPRMRWLLIGLQAAVVCMLIGFPLWSYNVITITGSSIHMVLAFMALATLWHVSRSWPKQGSGMLTRAAVVMFILSTLGILAIGPIIATGNQGKEIYYWAVQFFLHFQFNGWFWFAAMALGARWAERQGFALRIDRLTMGLWIVSAVLTYALAIAWSEPLPAVFATVAVAVALQVWAAWRTFGILRRMHNVAYDRIPQAARILIGVALVSMAMKVLVQASVAIPSVAIMALTIRHFVMGFVHMNTLGVMTMLLCSYAILSGWFDLKRGAIRWGLGLLVAGIITSELLLFVQGGFFWIGLGMIPGHYVHLFAASFLMPMGVVLLLIGSLKK
jgi:hypothetical protein